MRSSRHADPKASPQDIDFIVESVRSCKFLQEIAEIALQRDLKGPLQTLSEKILREQSSLDNDLRTIGQRLHVDLPTAIDSDVVLRIGDLNETGNEGFAENYLDQLTGRLQRMVGAFEEACADSMDEELRTLAIHHLPNLNSDLKTAMSLESVY